jgi:hypothetical protein
VFAAATGPARGAGPVGLRLQSADFVLWTTHAESRARQLAGDVSRFRRAVEALLGLQLPPGLPTRIFAMDAATWRDLGASRTGTAGLFVAHPFSADLLFDASTTAPLALELMFHEYVHYLLRTLRPEGHPAFFDEGLAEALSAVRFDRDRLRIALRPDHLQRLRRGAWLPFDRLVEVRRRDPHYVEPELAQAFYAQSWATVYFSLATTTADERRAVRYLRALDAGEPAHEAAAMLAGVPPEGANAEIRDFFFGPNAPAEIELFFAPDADASRAGLQAVDATTYRLALGELALRLGQRADRAAALFESTADPDPVRRARSEVGLAMARLQAGRRAESAALADRVAVPPDLPPESAVVLGRVLFQLSLATGRPDEPSAALRRVRAERARALFATALEAPYSWLEATNGYVLTSIALDRRESDLLGRAEAAFAAAPTSSELAVALALLHDLERRPTEARRYWTAAARNLQDGPARLRVLRELGQSTAAVIEPLPVPEAGRK